MQVLVTGATGFVGGALVPALLRADHDVSVLTRDAQAYDGPREVEVFEGNLLEEGSFDDALAAADVVYYLVHSMGADSEFARRDRRAARHFSWAATDAGVERTIYLGGLGETSAGNDEPADEEELSEHLASHREVEAILAKGRYDLTVLRSALVIGQGSMSFRLLRQLVERSPVLLFPQWDSTEVQPIAIDDAVAYLLGVLDVPETADEVFEIGGPDIFTYRELIERTADVLDRHVPTVRLPVLTPGLLAVVASLLTDVPRHVARALLEGLENRATVENQRINRFVSIEPTSYADAVRQSVKETVVVQ